MGQISNWARCTIQPPPKKRSDVLISPTYTHTHNRANDDQECSLLAQATVCPVSAHVPRRAPRRAYTHNEPHVRALDPHAPVVAKVGSNTICNASESKQLKSTLHTE